MSHLLFEETFGPERRRTAIAPKAAGLALTLVVHALLIYGLATMRFKVKIFTFEERVTRVYLAPPLKLEFPPDYQRHMASLSQFESGEEFFVLEYGRRSQHRAGRNDTAGEGVSQSSPVGPPANVRPMASPFGSAPGPAGSSSGFILRYKPGSEQKGVPELDLSLPSRSEAEARSRSARIPARDPRLRSYSSVEVSAGGAGNGHTLASSGRGDKVIYRGPVTAGARSVELTAWARLIVEEIQRHWLLPVSKKEITEGKVGITVIVEKDGMVTLVRIANSSNIALLDRSAVTAIAASLPFPRLPDDFPEKNLEVFFLFDCHEK